MRIRTADLALRAESREQAAWIGVFVASMLAPLLLMPFAGQQNFTFKVFAVAMGYGAYVGMALQVLMVCRSRVLASAGNLDVLVRLHRYMGVALLLMVAAHVGMFVQNTPMHMLEWLFFVQRHFKAWTGAAATWAMVGLAVTSLWRRKLRLSYEAWRAIHVVLTAVAILGAYAHVLIADQYTSFGPIRVLAAVVALSSVAGIVYLRVGRAFVAAQRPYTLLAVERERGGAVTLQLAPHRHGGIRFEPGQFGWLRFSNQPYSLTEHPFSVSSGADDPRLLSFTVKALGDHTARITSIPPGAAVHVDGPHGRAIEIGSRRLLLVVAGIGIAPAISILRTLAARPRMAPAVTVVYGTRRIEETTFLEELHRLEQVLDLDVHLVVSRPDGEWAGATGRITPELLRDLAPEDVGERDAFVCGPWAMIESVVATLLALGMHQERIHAERFEGA